MVDGRVVETDDRMLKIVNKNNKKSYRIVQETHLEDDCVIDS